MTSLPFKVKAVYDYSSPHEDDLSFSNGQIITVTDEEDTEWYYGEYVGPDGKQQGLFPRNFVERYEPTTPPRPSRRVKKDDTETTAPEPSVPPVPEIPPQVVNTITEPEPDPDPQPEPPRILHDTVAEADAEDADNDDGHSEPARIVEASLGPKPSQQPTASTKPMVQTAAPEAVPQGTKAMPPAIANKPSGGSFRDRIAAFNKPAAPPVAPMKPGGLSQSSTSGFVKKQYVAPPPSRNAYVPPPREPPAKAYRREADVSSPPQPASEPKPVAFPHLESSADDQAEEQPKPTSLKERIALLQKQQLEQAARHAEAAQKKEKPKRPPKKRTESQQDITGTIDDNQTGVAPSEEPRRTHVTETEDEETPDIARAAMRRSKSKDAIPLASPSSVPRELISDTNDADQSAGAETEDGGEISAGQPEERKPPRSSILPAPPRQKAPTDQQDIADDPNEADEDEGEDDQEGDTEEDVDPEVRRRLEIRERMAKMSGGMGMAGMFSPPGGLPPMGARKTKSSGSNSRKQPTDETQTESDNVNRQPVQAMALPGMSMPGIQRVRSPESVDGTREATADEDQALGLGIREDESDMSDDDHPETRSQGKSVIMPNIHQQLCQKHLAWK